MTKLHEFISTSNDIEKLRELLRSEQNPSQYAIDGGTALHIAVLKSFRNPEDIDEILLVARELINFGAIVDMEDCKKETPLHWAVRYRSYKMIELLLQANAEINRKDSDSRTALHYAAVAADLGLVKLLLKYNPEVDIRNRREQTPLMLAAENSSLQIVQELLKHNASVNLKDPVGNSAIHYALKRPEVNANIVLELMRHGCPFNISNDFMTTYISKLVNASSDEVEGAKCVFKLFVFDRKYFNCHQLKGIINISKEQNSEISRFLELCDNEIEQMYLDELVPNFSIYDIAFLSVFCNVYLKRIPSGVFDKVLDKLIKCQYPLYCDIILSSFCSPYMNKKFAEVCYNTEKIGRISLNFDVFYAVSLHLSEFDMLNTMIACSV